MLNIRLRVRKPAETPRYCEQDQKENTRNESQVYINNDTANAQELSDRSFESDTVPSTGSAEFQPSTVQSNPLSKNINAPNQKESKIPSFFKNFDNSSILMDSTKSNLKKQIIPLTLKIKPPSTPVSVSTPKLNPRTEKRVRPKTSTEPRRPARLKANGSVQKSRKIDQLILSPINSPEIIPNNLKTARQMSLSPTPLNKAIQSFYYQQYSSLGNADYSDLDENINLSENKIPFAKLQRYFKLPRKKVRMDIAEESELRHRNNYHQPANEKKRIIQRLCAFCRTSLTHIWLSGESRPSICLPCATKYNHGRPTFINEHEELRTCSRLVSYPIWRNEIYPDPLKLNPSERQQYFSAHLPHLNEYSYSNY